jgi:hypothetical protein
MDRVKTDVGLERLCNQLLRELGPGENKPLSFATAPAAKIPGQAAVGRRVIVEIEAPPTNCDVTRWSQFSDVRDIKKRDVPASQGSIRELAWFVNRSGFLGLGGQCERTSLSPLSENPSLWSDLRRHDLDLWLPVVKLNCAPDIDGFPLDHAKSRIGRYPGSGCNESGKLLMGVVSSKINKCGPQWASRYRDNPTAHFDFFADIMNRFGVFYHWRLIRTCRDNAEKQSKNYSEETDTHCRVATS